MHLFANLCLPWQLASVVQRLMVNAKVYGFELELLADYVSRH